MGVCGTQRGVQYGALFYQQRGVISYFIVPTEGVIWAFCAQRGVQYEALLSVERLLLYIETGPIWGFIERREAFAVHRDGSNMGLY